jgi:pimeloyl-ACP methyl ester carboxylesterase
MKLAQKLAKAFIILHLNLLALFSKRKAAVRAMHIFQKIFRRKKRDEPALFRSAERLEFIFNGTTIRGFRWNHPAERKALVLHGHDSSVLNFEMYLEGFLSKGYEVLAFDAPAHGVSDGESINALEYRDFIIYIHEHYGPVKSYIAHSFGGLALPLALEKIDHDDSYRLALVAPATESTTSIKRFFRFLHMHDPAVKEEFDKLIVEMSGHPASWYSVTRAISFIKAKVIWVHDEDDNVTPLSDALKVKEKNYPNVKFVITQGLGHNQVYRDERVMKSILDFL